jgi:hypothetical protein
MPGFSTPSMTRTTITTPRYGSYHESKMQRLQRIVGLASGRRQTMDDRFEHFVDAGAHLGAGEQRDGRRRGR